MKSILSLIIFFIPLTVLAHSGHGIEEQVHGFLHIEHLILIMAAAAAILFSKTIK